MKKILFQTIFPCMNYNESFEAHGNVLVRLKENWDLI